MCTNTKPFRLKTLSILIMFIMQLKIVKEGVVFKEKHKILYSKQVCAFYDLGE